MPNQNQNGRNVSGPDENRPSWRPHDQNQMSRGGGDERWHDRDDDRGQRGRGGGWMDDRDEGYRMDRQQGSAGGRYGDDRSMQRGQGMGQDEQRGGQGYWMDRPDRGYGRVEDRMRWRDRNMSEGSGEYFGQGDMDRGFGRGGYNVQQGRGGYNVQGYGQEHMGYGQGYVGHDQGDRGFQGERGFGRMGTGGGGLNQGQGRGGWGFERGSHRGKGPMGYTRSDERIRECVCEALSDDDNLDASNIDVTVRNGEVILAGTVEERYAKRLAEDLVERLPGVKDVQNQIKVQSQDQRRGTQGNQGSIGSNQQMKSETETQVSSDKRHRA